MGGVRYIASGVILGTWLKLQGHPLPGREDWGRLAILGFFMLMLGNGGVVWGEQFLSSGLTAVLIGTTPFWMVSVDAMFPGGDADARAAVDGPHDRVLRHRAARLAGYHWRRRRRVTASCSA